MCRRAGGYIFLFDTRSCLMKYVRWDIPDKGPEIPPELLRAGCTPLLAALLAGRGMSAPGEAARFLNAGEEELCDPMLLPDMPQAAARLRLAVGRGERVAVFGDYDVDGITSACMMTLYLRSKGLKCEPYIPDRLEEGYGLNMAAIDTLAAHGAQLIVTVDCGITAREEARHAKELGIDMIITDHHECGSGSLPEAVAVVDPKRPDSAYPNPGLAGVGVAFKLLCAVEGAAGKVLDEYADLIAAGTVADVMPLTGENRYIVRRGLKMLENPERAGIRALLNECGASGRRLNAATIGFTLAPRLNAAGRLGRTDSAVRLLLTSDEEDASNCAAELCQLNRHRQELEQEIWEEAHEMLRRSPPSGPIVLASERWHQGVIGIAASRLAEEFALPTVMICLNGEQGKGSCRSYGGFNLFDALSACSDCLEGFGGHALAAGLSIKRGRVDDFRAALEEYYRKAPPPEPAVLECELRVEDPALLTMDCVASLERLEPYGAGNARPTLCITDALLERVTPIGGGKHLRLRIAKGGAVYDAVMFSCREEELGARAGDRVDAAFFPQVNEYHGVRSVQLLITALRAADTLPLCREVLGNTEDIGPWEGSDLCPQRSDFVQVWRWLQRRGGTAEGGLADAAHWRPGGMHPAKLLLCLRVMRDVGLVAGALSGTLLSVHVLQREGKADLDAHPLVIRLRQLRQKYSEGR